MKTFEISKLSSKGQIVIPNSIRNKLKIIDGTNFAIFTDGDNILLKPIVKPNLQEFSRLIKESKKVINQSKLKKSELSSIIKDVRSQKK